MIALRMQILKPALHGCVSILDTVRMQSPQNLWRARLCLAVPQTCGFLSMWAAQLSQQAIQVWQVKVLRVT